VAARHEISPWGISSSLGLHALLIAALAVMPVPRRPEPSHEEPVSVDILSPDQFRAQTSPPPAPVAPPVSQAPTTAPLPEVAAPAPSRTPEMIRPNRMLSARTLADPRSRQARADLATFASDERMLQLCDLEAMDQIHAWRADFHPDRVVPYATARERIADGVVSAAGAAFRSRGNWFGLKFKCELSRDGGTVTGFEFLVGDPIAREKWDDLGLPAVH